MNLIITGLPGVGKGTQADKIVEKYNVKHLSTGNLFRAEIATGSELGLELKGILDAGNLVPDELTIKIFKNEVKKPEYDNGFLLDGFPRTKAQAEALDKMLKEENIILDGVIALELDEEVIIERIVNRLVCLKCGSTYHKIYVKPDVENICDNCGEELHQRADDKLEAVENRLSVAKSQTLPVIEYYENLDAVDFIKMDKSDSTDEVFVKISSVLDAKVKND